MPDRSLGTLPHGPECRAPVAPPAPLWRDRRPAPPRGPGTSPTPERPAGSGDGRPDDSPAAPDAQSDNPFAAPPDGTPDRPWQPRHGTGDGNDGGNDGEGDGRQGGDGGRSPWGSQWSDRQPGRAPGGFGERPGERGERDERGQGGGPGGPRGGMRWDPTDPAQRRARYALLGGMWAFFFALFGWLYVAMLLGALSVYWATSALRGGPTGQDPASAPREGSTEAAGGGRRQAAGTDAGRQKRTAALTGLVTASVALVLVAGNLTAHLVYRDYYTCTRDALTTPARQSCADLLPADIRDWVAPKD